MGGEDQLGVAEIGFFVVEQPDQKFQQFRVEAPAQFINEQNVTFSQTIEKRTGKGKNLLRAVRLFFQVKFDGFHLLSSGEQS